MNANPEVVLKRMSEAILPAFVEDLGKEQERLASEGVEEFMSYVTGLLDGIFFEVVQKFGVSEMSALGNAAAIQARGYAVECLNGALPPEHPFILALLKLGNDPDWKYLTLIRKKYGKFHEMLTPNVVPLIFADSREALDEGVCEMKVFQPGEMVKLTDTEQ